MGEKSPDAFRTISEVATDLDLPQHVLRFWETRFSQIKPLKRGGGRRYYRPDDIHLLRGIRRLLYGDGYTIKGVQRILREDGVRHVVGLGRDDVTEGHAPAQEAVSPATTLKEPARLEAPHRQAAPTSTTAPSPVAATAPVQNGALRAVDPSLDMETDEAGDTRANDPAGEGAARPVPAEPERFDGPPVLTRGRREERADGDDDVPVANGAAVPATAQVDGSRLSKDDARKLKAAVFELMECRRILDGKE